MCLYTFIITTDYLVTCLFNRASTNNDLQVKWSVHLNFLCPVQSLAAVLYNAAMYVRVVDTPICM